MLVTALAASAYFAPMLVLSRSPWAMLAQLSAVAPRIFSVVFAIGMLAIGYSVSLFLDRARYGSRPRNVCALFTGVIASMFIADFFLSRGLVQVWHWLLTPDLWFAAGVAAYIVLKSSLYDRSPEPSLEYPQLRR